MGSRRKSLVAQWNQRRAPSGEYAIGSSAGRTMSLDLQQRPDLSVDERISLVLDFAFSQTHGILFRRR